MLSEQLANAEAAEPAGQPDRWRRLLLVLLAISSAIVALSLLLPALVHHELTRDVGAARVFTFVGAEANLPTWWSASLLFGAALLHVQAGALARRSGIKGASAWWILAVLFAALVPTRRDVRAEQSVRRGTTLRTARPESTMPRRP
jgi:hypothetical protein